MSIKNPRDKNTKASDLAFMGILLGINQALLYFAGVTSFNESFFLGIASLIIGIVMIEKGFKNAVVFYISSAMLGFILMPNKLNALGYIFILGLYTLLKAKIEKYNSLKVEVLIKVIYFAIVGGISGAISEMYIFKGSFFTVFISMLLLMGIYDYASTVLLSQYRTKFKGFNK